MSEEKKNTKEIIEKIVVDSYFSIQEELIKIDENIRKATEPFMEQKKVLIAKKAFARQIIEMAGLADRIKKGAKK